MFGEVVSGAGAIGTVHHLDGLVGATQFAVVGDGSEENPSQLLLGELELTTRVVVGHGDGACGHRDLHHATAHLGDRRGLHGLVGGAEVNGASGELAHTSARAHRLIVDVDALWRQILEPTLVNRCRKGGACGREPTRCLLAITTG